MRRPSTSRQWSASFAASATDVTVGPDLPGLRFSFGFSNTDSSIERSPAEDAPVPGLRRCPLAATSTRTPSLPSAFCTSADGSQLSSATTRTPGASLKVSCKVFVIALQMSS